MTDTISSVHRHPWSTDFTWDDRVGPFTTLSEAQVAHFDELGYVVLPSVLDADLLAEVREEIDGLEQKMAEYLEAQEGGRIAIAETGAITFTAHIVARSPLLRKLSKHPTFVGVCADLVGPDVNLYWDHQVAPYLVLATKNGLVKKTRLEEFDSNRSGGIIGINLRDEDELVGAALAGPQDDLLLVSKRAQAIRFNATDEALRPMGRATSGVIGMRFSEDDVLLAMEVVREGMDVLVATNGGYAKRTPIEEYPVQGRGGKGVLTAKITERRGGLVGAVVINPDDELFAITSNGGVIRTPVKPVRRTRDRNTMGVKLMDLPDGVTIVAIARNADEPDEQD